MSNTMRLVAFGFLLGVALSAALLASVDMVSRHGGGKGPVRADIHSALLSCPWPGCPGDPYELVQCPVNALALGLGVSTRGRFRGEASCVRHAVEALGLKVFPWLPGEGPTPPCGDTGVQQGKEVGQ